MFERISTSDFREIERELSQPLFYGVPLGPMLNDYVWTRLMWRSGDPRLSSRLLNKARIARHRLRPRHSSRSAPSVPIGCILMTWFGSTPRLDEMILPILNALECDGCSTAVVYDYESVVSRLPPRVPGAAWEHIMAYDVKAWRAEYARCFPELKRSLTDVCRGYGLPEGAFESMSLNLLVASQRVAGCLEFLNRTTPSVIVTEYDRNHLWSCLVLAAKRVGVPTVSLVHGIIEQDAVGYSPILADKIICWGELDRKKLLMAGESAERIEIGGCPRLSRELSVTGAEGRATLGLDPSARVVLFATSPERDHLETVELFCSAMASLSSVVGVVRLHPSQNRITHITIASRYPQIRFIDGSQATLDESLAAADVVVVSQSGVGGDALLKGRPVIVLNRAETLTGAGWDLVELAGCPHARSPQELAGILGQMTRGDVSYRRPSTAAEEYVAKFCGAFGHESARRIADIVKDTACPSTGAASNRLE